MSEVRTKLEIVVDVRHLKQDALDILVESVCKHSDLSKAEVLHRLQTSHEPIPLLAQYGPVWIKMKGVS